PDDPGPDALEPAAALPNEVHWVRNSAEYRASVWQTYQAARQTLDAQKATDSLPAQWAVALDVDETVLSNSLYRRERALGLGTSWPAWTRRREATVLPGARAFIDHVRAMGGVVALVTNRHVSQCRDTAENLAAEDVEYDVLLCQDGTSDKRPRWESVEAGTAAEGVAASEIVLWLGDNIHDFPGLEQELRLEDESALLDFGRRYFVLPNPMSGSWSSNPKL